MEREFTIAIVTRGQSGKLTYHEGSHRHEFDWEFGGGDSVVIVHAPTPARWPAELPWAADRREEVLTRVAQDLVRQKCFGCRYVVHGAGIDILQPPRAR